jgi:hypothetical protein
LNQVSIIEGAPPLALEEAVESRLCPPTTSKQQSGSTKETFQAKTAPYIHKNLFLLVKGGTGPMYGCLKKCSTLEVEVNSD